MRTIHPTSIAAVIEANTSAYLLSFALLPDAVLHDHPRCVWVDSGVADATFNSVVSARFDPITVDSQIESVLSYFRQRSRPVTWHVGPSTEPTDLGTFLLAHGMVHAEDEPGMAVEIASMQEDTGVHEGFTIETVRDEMGLEEWVAVWLFPVPAEKRRPYLDALRLRGLGEDLP